MSELIVADIGNSRMKWGRCDAKHVVASASLPLDDPKAWQTQLSEWALENPLEWAVAGVNPAVMADFADWLRLRCENASCFDHHRQLPIRLNVQSPEQVGMDRLLNAVAAASRTHGAAILIDAGSAVTVDWLDEEHVFQGGAIFPGLRLMGKALHDYTAKLPLVDSIPDHPFMPGKSTESAIAVGIHSAVVGGILCLIGQLTNNGERKAAIYVTGGDAALLMHRLEACATRTMHRLEACATHRRDACATHPERNACITHWPTMTLEGIRLTYESAL